MKTWRPLRPGDIVDLVAPGFYCKPEELQGAIAFVRQWGFVPRLPKRIFQKDILCSSPDEIRFEFLRQALLAPDSAAVWCLRGGYGSIRLLPRLKKLRAPRQAKLFVGLSDITSLHLYLTQEWGWSTIHGPMLDRLGKGGTAPRFVRELHEVVSGEQADIVFAGLRPLNELAARRAVIRAPLSGGNLITLQASLGTPFAWRTRGQILFFEDIGERGYRVDRVLEHFAHAGLFHGIRAVVFGDFTGATDPDGKDRVPAVLRRFAQVMRVPVLKGIQSGHGPIQRPVPFATRATLRLGEKPQLIVPSGVEK